MIKNRNIYIQITPPILVFLLTTLCFYTLASTSVSKQLDHSKYPLEGNHQSLSCSQCHTNSTQSETVNCIGCHQQNIPTRTSCTGCHEPRSIKSKQTHQNSHFGKHCAKCHTTGTWFVYKTDDTAKRCISCHADDKPAPHYKTNQCNLCHIGKSWNDRHFSHDGFISCTSCHTRPRLHKSGDCTDCHDTVDWENGTYFPIRKYLNWLR